MQTEKYRDALVETLKTLKDVNNEMHSRMIDLITAGELSDWNASVPVGEILSFDWKLFKNSDDTNIAMVVKCIELVDSTYNSIKNINAIEINENEDNDISN